MTLNNNQIQALYIKLDKDINKKLEEKYKQESDEFIKKNKKQYTDFLSQFDNTIELLKTNIIVNLVINISYCNTRLMNLNNYENILKEFFISKYSKITKTMFNIHELKNDIILATINNNDLDTLIKNITAKYI